MDEFYNYSIVAGWVSALILGICLLWCRVPDIQTYGTYLRSRRVLGVAYLIFAIGISQFTFFNLRLNHPHVAVAWPLTYFYLEGILWGMSFSSLLDPGYISRARLASDFGCYAAFLVIAWGGALMADGAMRTAMLVAASAWFFVMAAGIALRFLKLYRRTRRMIDDYYADNVEGFVMWLHKSTYGIIFLGLCGAILAFCPRWCNAIFMLCGIALFTYVFVSFQNYILNYPVINTVIEESDGQSVRGSSDVNETLRKAIGDWIARNGFAEPGVTLDRLAKYVGVNRSYVSAFINSEYRCTFRELVNRHRLTRAKLLLKENPAATIDKISQDAGFTSAAYFSRLFTKQEGISPSKWRETH
ncbi:MAG: AraC family transcriptional regulator [Pseudoflavonifractor sp.]|nr:AraC family transcriptional regulator [Pseudoflavonifractor sp.]